MLSYVKFSFWEMMSARHYSQSCFTTLISELVCAAALSRDRMTNAVCVYVCVFKNSEMLADLTSLLGHLSKENCEQLKRLIFEFRALFLDTLTRTHLIEHDIDVRNAAPVRQRFYHVSPEKVFRVRGNISVDSWVGEAFKFVLGFSLFVGQ